MKIKATLLQPIALVIAVLWASAGLSLAYNFNSHQPAGYKGAHSLALPLKSATPQSFYGLPVTLKIPSINIDTPINYMGMDANGDMAVPVDSSSVGWYKFGTIPGELGSAVIAGHVVGAVGQAGVFINLDKLQIGDALQVIDAKGRTSSFTVRGTATFGQTEQPANVFSSTSGKHLNLITCSGDWDASAHHYLSRLVVFADKTP